MIRRLINLNLKGTNNKLYSIILIITGIMVTYINLGILNIPNTDKLLMGDIVIAIYGGLPSNYEIIQDIMPFITWVIPNVLIVYLIDICILYKLRTSTILTLPRVKNKLKWFAAFNLTMILIVIKYFLILIITSLIVIFVRMGPSAFRNSLLIVNNFNDLYANVNQYLVLFYIFILNILSVTALLMFINNLYYIFFCSNEASVIGILFCIVAVVSVKLNPLTRFMIMNQGMFKRHDIVRMGFKGLSIGSSILYLICFITINFFIGVFIIRKRDINNI